jgi:hypothetical protein
MAVKAKGGCFEGTNGGRILSGERLYGAFDHFE